MRPDREQLFECDFESSLDAVELAHAAIVTFEPTIDRALRELGLRPLGSFDDGLARVTESFSVPGILAAAVRHPKSGAMTAAQLRLLRVNELTVHAWDLARAIDSDDRLDERVVSWLLEGLEPLRSTVGLYEPGPADDLPAASPQGSLLRLLGRAG